MSRFGAFTTDDLLDSCLHGGIQNHSEAFNALIWQWPQKTKHGRKTIKSNMLEPGILYETGCRKIDKQRIDLFRCQSTDEANARRRASTNREGSY